MRSVTLGRIAPFLLILCMGAAILAGCQRPLIQIAVISKASSALANVAATPPVPAVRAIGSTRTPDRAPTATVPVARRPDPAVAAPDRLVIHAINLDAPVVTAGWSQDSRGHSVWQTPQHEVGFLQGSALPGYSGNTVLSGHHNVGDKVFARLHEVLPGDAIQLFAGNAVYRYVVEDAFILPERGVSEEQRLQNARWIGPTNDERLTLVTCWPANDNSHRVIVVARPGK